MKTRPDESLCHAFPSYGEVLGGAPSAPYDTGDTEPLADPQPQDEEDLLEKVPTRANRKRPGRAAAPAPIAEDVVASDAPTRVGVYRLVRPATSDIISMPGATPAVAASRRVVIGVSRKSSP